LYEAIGLGVLGWLLLVWRRRGVPEATVLGRYLLAAGALRFAIEFIRVNDRIIVGLSVAHLASVAVAAVGALMLVTARPGRLVP
jgi:phosphatidylglycerol---prolipoprotein diacylglyceryl transferase